MKERDPKGTSKTLMPPIGIQKSDGSENVENDPKRNQIAHLQGQTTRPNHKVKSNLENK